jgi:hypothetical protein
MPHVQLASDIRRGHNDGVWNFIGVNLCGEISVFLPRFIQAVFHLRGVVSFGQFSHKAFLFSCKIKYQILKPLKPKSKKQKNRPKNWDGIIRGTTQIAEERRALADFF